MQEAFTEGVDPRCRGGGAEELEEVGFREWWGCLGSEGCSLLGDAFKLPAKASHLVKGAGASCVDIHWNCLREAIGLRVVNPATDQFPGPENVKHLFTGDAKGLCKGG